MLSLVGLVISVVVCVITKVKHKMSQKLTEGSYNNIMWLINIVIMNYYLMTVTLCRSRYSKAREYRI